MTKRLTVLEQISAEIDRDKKRDAARHRRQLRAAAAPRCGVCGGKLSASGQCIGDGFMRCGLFALRAGGAL